MRTGNVARLVFAATLAATGIYGLINGDLVAIWQVPKAVPARAALSYLSASLSLACGVGLVWQRAAAAAARLLLACLLVWLLLFKAPVVFRAPARVVAWEDFAETLVIVAAASAWCAGERATRMARLMYGFALIPFGLAHFAYIGQTAALVPAWLPSHEAWAWLTGGAYIAAGVAVMTGVFERLAAALSALQMGAFTLLVWCPIIAGGRGDASQVNETFISLALTASGWVIAESYTRMPWLRPRLRPARPG
jgi:uncharacterized membrane protein